MHQAELHVTLAGPCNQDALPKIGTLTGIEILTLCALPSNRSAVFPLRHLAPLHRLKVLEIIQGVTLELADLEAFGSMPLLEHLDLKLFRPPGARNPDISGLPLARLLNLRASRARQPPFGGRCPPG